MPTEDRFLISKTELLAKIATLLGGRAAESVIVNDISTGAHNDLFRATDIAPSMVKECGMSENVGQVYYARKSRSRFLATEPEGAGEYSEATAESIDQRVKEIIAQQYKRAMEIVITKRPGLEKGAQMLLEQEKNEAAEIKTLMEAA